MSMGAAARLACLSTVVSTWLAHERCTSRLIADWWLPRSVSCPSDEMLNAAGWALEKLTRESMSTHESYVALARSASASPLEHVSCSCVATVEPASKLFASTIGTDHEREVAVSSCAFSTVRTELVSV
jgi:hypothetical protein